MVAKIGTSVVIVVLAIIALTLIWHDSTPLGDSSSLQSEQIQSIRNFFANQPDERSNAGVIIGRAKEIVMKFESQADPIGEARAEVERRKKQDPNHYQANLLRTSIELVNWLGLSKNTSRRNKAFLGLDPPLIEQ